MFALRDRALVLRILDESLCNCIRKKMADVEERDAELAAAKLQQQQQASHYRYHNQPSPTAPTESKLFDLDGVSCVPANQSSFRMSNSTNSSSSNDKHNGDDVTLWVFHCDGKKYPARLSNLPCPVELHKTRDRKLYHKCVNVAQVLAVYSDHRHLEAMERLYPKCEGFPSYHPSGITPPMGKCVENRFAKREHGGVPPPRQEIMEVEKELMELVKRVNKDGGKKTGGGGGSKGGGASQGSKVLLEYEDEVVQYEPWMDNYGTGKGVEFVEDDELCLQHPELWLDPKEMGSDKKNTDDDKFASAEGEIETVTKPKKKSPNGSPSKKKGKKNKNKNKNPKVAVNRPSVRNEEKVPIDDVEKIAQNISQNKDDDLDALIFEGDDFFDFDKDEDLDGI